ncbi:2-amino-4-hydroxy-6-hydroxymethyldihydropteridine diphosphokinase [Ferruginibacter sp.]
MSVVYLLLGSNMGDSRKQLQKARKNIEQLIGPISRSSALYQTAAWGNNHQPDFLNQVVIVHTTLTPATTMQTILAIEKKMGRIRTVKNAPRIVDIDIIFFNKHIIHTTELTVPHPQLQHRRFVLVPLNQLSPNLKHPVLHKTIHQLLRICKDPLTVHKISG